MPTTMMRTDYPDMGDRATPGVGGPPLWEMDRVRYMLIASKSALILIYVNLCSYSFLSSYHMPTGF